MPGVAVSVVLPTYNRALTIERAIESVLNQTFADLEILVVDDGSTDDTHLVLSKYAGRSNVTLVSTPHRGCSAARNMGIKMSRGRYVAFQDSDDEWVPEKLATAMAFLDGTAPETGVFYSDMMLILPDGRSAVLKSPEVERGVLVDERTLDYQVLFIGIQSAVIKRQCFDEAGCFDEALPRLIDLELLIRLSDKFRFVRCQEVLVKYYFGDGISMNSQALVAARRHLIHKYRDRLKQRKHHLAKQYLHLAYALRYNGEKYKSLRFILRAFLTSPRHARIRKDVLASVRGMPPGSFAQLYG
jgi:glycosyltransferase involved in cell wall biosynthesis